MALLATIKSKIARAKVKPAVAADAVAPHDIEAAAVDAKVRDDPVAIPDDDLLGMAFYAETLVEYVLRIQAPFTIGIYGEWGAGKTSLVNLLHHYVRTRDQSVVFVEFTAWPYKAPDELWRALVLKIARRLYDKPDDPEQTTRTKSTTYVSWAESLRQYLRGPAWGSGDTQPADAYEELLGRLDETLYGGIGRGRGAQIQLNDQEMMVAALKTATTALESVTPFFGTLRKLFGLDEKIDFVSLLHRQKNEATRDRIDSITKFKAEMKAMFETLADKKRVCVFVDDLDRVMPDVALDLMEAIKSLLEGVKCTFIVAADQQLIGQGLKVRFRDLIEGADGHQVSEFYNRKGREYFEKIIQLGIPVPEPSLEQAHRYIAAQFPTWAASSDLMVAAVGSNPRRLKQYCVLADYRFSVWKNQQRHNR